MFGPNTTAKCLVSGPARLAALIALVAVTGCGTPALVEGVVANEAYRIADNEPALRIAYGDLALVLSEEDGETLRAVAIQVPDFETAALGEPLPIGALDEGRPTISVSEGDLVVTTRGDGARILSSENNTFADIAEGTVTLHDVDELVTGELFIELKDGGHLEGSFAVARP